MTTSSHDDEEILMNNHENKNLGHKSDEFYLARNSEIVIISK